jgi:hypothetical protein
MQRLALNLALMGAALVAGAAWTGLPRTALAFDVETGATNPGGNAGFGDPDEAAMPAPLSSPRLEVDGTAAMMGSTYGSNPADNAALIPTPTKDMPFWSFSGAPAQRFR